MTDEILQNGKLPPRKKSKNKLILIIVLALIVLLICAVSIPINIRINMEVPALEIMANPDHVYERTVIIEGRWRVNNVFALARRTQRLDQFWGTITVLERPETHGWMAPLVLRRRVFSDGSTHFDALMTHPDTDEPTRVWIQHGMVMFSTGLPPGISMPEDLNRGVIYSGFLFREPTIIFLLNPSRGGALFHEFPAIVLGAETREEVIEMHQYTPLFGVGYRPRIDAND